MKLKCKKCGTMIAVPQEAKRAADPRVECPQCQTCYRLRRETRKGTPTSPNPQTASNFTVTPSSFGAVASPGTPSPLGTPQQPSAAPPGSVPSSPWTGTLTSMSSPADQEAATDPPVQDDDAPTQLLTPSSAAALDPARKRAEASPAAVSQAAPTATAAPAVAAVASTPPASSVLTPASVSDSLQSTPGGGGSLQAFQAEAILAERYRIVRFLAHGGMGEVYEAEDLELKERLALKTISPAAGATQDVATIDRFKREIALARAVTHPNVCRIFDLGQHSFVNRRGGQERVTFLTMELLKGETLSARLRRRKRLSPAEALPLVQQMAAALDAAHAAKVVHRDFKSENVFLVPVDDRFRAVVTDFGVARGSDGADSFAAQVTGTGIVGTPSYMAPEQVEGKEVTPAADVYAFGVVIYEMLTGCLPFEGPTPLSTAVKRLQEAPPTPRIHVPDIPGYWEKAIMRCLERQPEDRFTSAHEVASALASRPDALPAHRPVDTSSLPMSPEQGLDHRSYADGFLAGSSLASKTQDRLATPPPPSPPSGQVGVTRPAAAQVAPRDTQRQKTLIAILALVLVISGGLFLFNQFKNRDQRVVPRRSVAVLGFKNLTGQPDADWLATALTEILTTEMGRGEALRSIASDNVARVRQELGIEDVTAIEPEDLAKMRSLLACDFVVSGSYTRLGGGENGLRVDLRLRDAALGDAVATASQQGAEADLFPMASQLGEEVREALGIGEAGEDAFAGLPTDGEAARLYAEALERLRASDPGQARQLLQQAVSREPTNALLHSALSSAWEAEGYRARAAQSAERAFELSSQLPQEDRLVVEGHFREIQGDWQAASAIYTTLWEFFPDDLDYGLHLVAAENNARQPAMALSTIERLRILPAPLSEDPRIDLAEATSAALLNDVDRQLAAADRALERSETLGANLLMAQAQIARSQALRHLGRMDDAEQAAHSAEALYTTLEHPSGAAMARTVLANSLAERGSFDAAAQHYRQAIETYRTIGDQATTATGLNNLAMVLRKKGDMESAESLYQEVVTIYEETDNRLGIANTENNLGVLWVSQDRLADALSRFQETQKVWEKHGDRVMQAYALNNIAAVARLQGKLWDSRALHQKALDLRKELGHKNSEVTSLTNLAGLLLDLGELESSQDHLSRALTLANEIGDRAGQAEVLFCQSELDLVRDRLPEAQTAAEQAIELRQELLQERQVADARLLLARILIEQGDNEQAEALAREVLRRHRADQRPGDTALALEVLARALAAGQRSDEAQAAISEALLLAVDTERRSVGLQLEITANLIEAGNGGPTATSLQRLSELEKQIETDGYSGLRLEAAFVGGQVAALGGRRQDALQRLANLEAEAGAAGFDLLARKAGEAALE